MLGKPYEVAPGDTRNWFLWLLHAVMPVSLSPAFLMRECMAGCPILLEREFRWAIAVSIAAVFSGFLFCGVLCQHISFELCCLFGHPSHFGLSYPRASALWGVTLRGSVSPFFPFFLLFRIRCLVLTLTSTLLFFLLARWMWILFDILNRN